MSKQDDVNIPDLELRYALATRIAPREGTKAEQHKQPRRGPWRPSMRALADARVPPPIQCTEAIPYKKQAPLLIQQVADSSTTLDEVNKPKGCNVEAGYQKRGTLAKA